MADILIRDLSETVVAEIDGQASRLGISRAEYVRRQLTAEAQRLKRRVTIEDLSRFSQLAADLLDDDVMERAWR